MISDKIENSTRKNKYKIAREIDQIGFNRMNSIVLLEERALLQQEKSVSSRNG